MADVFDKEESPGFLYQASHQKRPLLLGMVAICVRPTRFDFMQQCEHAHAHSCAHRLQDARMHHHPPSSRNKAISGSELWLGVRLEVEETRAVPDVCVDGKCLPQSLTNDMADCAAGCQSKKGISEMISAIVDLRYLNSVLMFV